MRKRNRRPRSASSIRIYLSAVRASISGQEVLNDSALAALVVDDICWSIAYDAWISGKPRRWRRREWRRWEAEYEALDDERQKIETRAQRCRVFGA